MNKLTSGVTSLFDIAKNMVEGKDQYVSAPIQEKRQDLCNACPKLLVTKQCGECLCFVNFKTKFKQERCPLGHWEKEET